jgi:hypothetical protein
LDFSSERDLRPEAKWIQVTAFGLSLFIRDFAGVQAVWDASFCFLRFKCLPPGQSADCPGDPVKCRFICWMSGFMSQIRQPLLELQDTIWARQLIVSESVSLRVESRHTEVIEAEKLLGAFWASSLVSMWIREKVVQKVGFETAPSLCGFQ